MRLFALIVSALGLLVFGGALAVSLVQPIAIERTARDLLRREVEKRVDQRLDALDDTTIGRLAGQLLRRNQEDASRIKQQIREGLPQRIAARLAEMLDANCECRKLIGTRLGDAFAGTLASLAAVGDRLNALIRTKYAEVAGLLIREFRIFTGANALVFGLLGLVTLARPRARLHLILPMTVLLGGATLVAYFYLFHQNWLHTVVFNDYVGWWYLPWLGFAIAWLSDIVLNHGRITASVLEATLGSVIEGFSISPC